MPNCIIQKSITNCYDTTSYDNMNFRVQSIEMNISTYSGKILYKTTIESEYDFMLEFEKYRNYYIESNTRKILSEKTINK